MQSVGERKPKAERIVELVEKQQAVVLEQQQRNFDQTRLVLQRQQEQEQEMLAMREDKLVAKEEQCIRFRAGQQSIAEERKESAKEREEIRQRINDQAWEIEEERIKFHGSLIVEKDHGCERSLSRRAEEQREVKERLQRRSDRVQQSADDARRVHESKLEEMEQRHVEAMHRSQAVLEANREDVQTKITDNRERRQEREHQVERLARIRATQRFIRVTEMEEDTAVFAEATRKQDFMRREIGGMAGHLSVEGRRGICAPTQAFTGTSEASETCSTSPSDEQQLCLEEQRLNQLSSLVPSPWQSGALAITEA